jgi:hypothetical protein
MSAKHPHNAKTSQPLPIPPRVRRIPKPGKRSFFGKLSRSQRRQLIAWLRGGLTYRAAAARLKSEFGVVTSNASMSAIWHKFCAPVSAVATPVEASKPVVWDVTICARFPGQPAAPGYTVSFTLPSIPAVKTRMGFVKSSPRQKGQRR